MGAKTRPYLIEERLPSSPGHIQRRVLVEATNPAQALRHIAERQYAVSVPSALEVISLMRSGVVIETAGEDGKERGPQFAEYHPVPT